MQFPIDTILIVPSKNDFMNEIGAFVTVYTQIPTSNLNVNFSLYGVGHAYFLPASGIKPVKQTVTMTSSLMRTI